MLENFANALEDLNNRIMNLSEVVESNIKSAVNALEKSDVNLAKKVIEIDDIVDDSEVKIEEECCKVLAIHQPVAKDLRQIIVITKINSELERIGDMAVTIAKKTIESQDETHEKVLPYLLKLSDMVCEMLNKSIKSFTIRNEELAKEVINMEPKLKELKRATRKTIIQCCNIEKDNDKDLLIVESEVLYSLARIGSRSINIAEDVVFQLLGEIVRHQ